MDRRTALRVMGVGESARPDEVLAAYRSLRAHIEARSQSGTDAAFLAARRAEMRQLEEALRVATAGSAVADPSDSEEARRRRALVVAGAVASFVAVAALAAFFGGFLDDVGLDEAWVGEVGTVAENATPEAAGDAVGPAPPPPAPGNLVVIANVAGAVLEIAPIAETTPDTSPADPAGAAVEPVPLVIGMADGTPHTVPPGVYRLRVAHPDCPDDFETSSEIRSEAQVEIEARVCSDTGWVVVRSNVSGDRLRIDGRPAGSTSPRRIPLRAGNHDFRVEKPGFRRWEMRAAVGPAEILTLRANLPVREVAEAPPADPGGEITGARGGSHDWFDEVGAWMLRRHDLDGSGLIDEVDEVESISCETWRGLEASYATGRLGAPMSRLYGFDGSRWVDGALGFDLDMRGLAFERMQACGLR